MIPIYCNKSLKDIGDMKNHKHDFHTWDLEHLILNPWFSTTLTIASLLLMSFSYTGWSIAVAAAAAALFIVLVIGEATSAPRCDNAGSGYAIIIVSAIICTLMAVLLTVVFLMAEGGHPWWQCMAAAVGAAIVFPVLLRLIS